MSEMANPTSARSSGRMSQDKVLRTSKVPPHCKLLWYRAKLISPVQVPVGRANLLFQLLPKAKKVRVSASHSLS